MNIVIDKIPADHFLVEYYLESRTTLYEAAYALAVGQSIGNPSVRNVFETPELIANHCAKIVDIKERLDSRNKGTVAIAYPAANINWEEDGISHLVCNIMGGQTDIDIIQKCHITDIELQNLYPVLQPKFGITGLREKTGQYEKPLLGCILKPKIGLKPTEIVSIVKDMIDGGADFIKEDEIMSNPVFCKYEDRLPLIKEILPDNVVYLATCNSDPHKLVERAKKVHEYGSNGIHINLWSGLGAYASVRQLDLPLVMHYQKSGDKVITHVDNPYRIDWRVLCKLAAISGIDTIHAGMWGGYLSDEPTYLQEVMDILRERNVLPALSCGMNAQLIPKVTEKFGYDYLANVGGAVHSHKDGIKAAVIDLRNAIDK